MAIAFGPPTYFICGRETGNAVQAAVIAAGIEIVKLLIERGADVNEGGEDYESPVIDAAVGGQQQIAQLLIEKGAEVDKLFGGLGTAVVGATLADKDETVRLLVKEGADPDMKGEDYASARKLAEAKGKLCLSVGVFWHVFVLRINGYFRQATANAVRLALEGRNVEGAEFTSAMALDNLSETGEFHVVTGNKMRFEGVKDLVHFLFMWDDGKESRGLGSKP
ncbi:hypothetical protein V490_01337 [Pseudogymnoascus sp. VKM F-3557]|nr:hypothetical protein V490_01337 [Pseudogymnoascus sp. VKM F-3557]